jgi:polyisoprenoid-binding protein YceI
MRKNALLAWLWLTAPQAALATVPQVQAAGPATPTRLVAISPANAHITYTAFALGLVPFSGSFERFSGTADAATGTRQAGGCAVHVNVDVASLLMPDADRQRQAVGADMLDASHYPTMMFRGTCRGQSLIGHLTLHGVTRPFAFALKRNGTHITCTATLARRDFGITGMPTLVAPRVRIRLSVTLPG